MRLGDLLGWGWGVPPGNHGRDRDPWVKILNQMIHERWTR